jgi:predicted TIM-barrel fold metal-dependent hydrolase
LVDDETLRRMHASGVRALRLNLRGLTDYREYESDAWGELLVRAYALGWHLEVFIDPGRARAIAPLLAQTPIEVVFDHFGMPGTVDATVDATFRAVERLAASRPVWGKLSAPYRLIGGDPLAFTRRWIDIVGPGRVVWGSDWPWTTYEDAGDYGRLRNALDRWVGAERVDAVLWDNALRLYDFDPADSA